MAKKRKHGRQTAPAPIMRKRKVHLNEDLKLYNRRRRKRQDRKENEQ